MPVLVEQLFQGLRHSEAGEHFGGVVRRRLLPFAAREAVDERALRVQDLPCPHRWSRPGRGRSPSARCRRGPLNRHHPGPLGGVTVLGHLVQIGLGEEAGVGHQALVDRAELVDAELGVGDEAAVSCPWLPC